MDQLSSIFSEKVGVQQSLDSSRSASSKVLQEYSQEPGRAVQKASSVELSISTYSESQLAISSGRAIFAQELSSRFSLYMGAPRDVSDSAKPSSLVSNVLSGMKDSMAGLAERFEEFSELAEVFLAEARDRFNETFDAAERVLKDEKIESPEIEEELSQGYAVSQFGVQELSEQYVSLPSKEADEADEVDGSEPSTGAVSSAYQAEDGSDDGLSVDDGKVRGGSFAGVNASVYGSESTSFSLTTQDGDIVEISLSEQSFSQFQYAAGRGFGALSFEAGFESQFQFSVEGELDEGELGAIADLLDQLSAVSGEFFSGNFQEAFQKALNVGFDTSEIAQFSLELTKVQVEQVSAYQSRPGVGRGNEGASYRPLVSMANQAQRLFSMAERYEASMERFMDFFAESLSQSRSTDSREGVEVADFKDYLLALFDTTKAGSDVEAAG